MYMLAGEWMPFCEPDPLPLAQRIESARQGLVRVTGQDFGYDLQKWHDYLVEHHQGENAGGMVFHKKQISYEPPRSFANSAARETV